MFKRPPSIIGVFMASPTSGVALTTSFILSTSSWIDENLPLTYQFLFYPGAVGSTVNLPLLVQSQSQFTYTVNPIQLPARVESAEHVVYCSVNAIDSYQATNSLQTGISFAISLYVYSKLSSLCSVQVLFMP